MKASKILLVYAFRLIIFVFALTALIVAANIRTDPLRSDEAYIDNLFVGEIHGQSPVGMNDTLEMKQNNVSNAGTLTTQLATVGADQPPNAYSVLELVSDTKGLLLPRLTTANRTAMVNIRGMFVFDTDLNEIFYNTGAAWTSVSGGGGMQAAYDNGPNITAATNPLIWAGDATLSQPLLSLDQSANTSAALSLVGQTGILFPEENTSGVIECADATAPGSGTSLVLNAGAGLGSGSGGDISLVAGAGGATAGQGGAVNISGGVADNDAGGNVNLTAGTPTTQGDGGDIAITSGTGIGAAFVGGDITLECKPGVFGNGRLRIIQDTFIYLWPDVAPAANQVLRVQGFDGTIATLEWFTLP